MKESKKSVSFRLSDTTVKELADLAMRYKVSQAQVITVLVHQFYANGDMGDGDSIDEWFNVVRMA